MADEKKRLLEYWKKDKVVTDANILKALSNVKREDFIPFYEKRFAYDDNPLPIGEGQTISQPTTVALMTQALKPKRSDKILEIGTGSGYQTAILSEVVGNEGLVVTIEYVKKLYLQAKKRLAVYKNVVCLHGDGSKGVPGYAPYDGIIVTAGADKLPKALTEQLKLGGILVIPVGEYIQDMLKITKTKTGLSKENLGEFRFVPLIFENQ